MFWTTSIHKRRIFFGLSAEYWKKYSKASSNFQLTSFYGAFVVPHTCDSKCLEWCDWLLKIKLYDIHMYIKMFCRTPQNMNSYLPIILFISLFAFTRAAVVWWTWLNLLSFRNIDWHFGVCAYFLMLFRSFYILTLFAGKWNRLEN